MIKITGVSSILFLILISTAKCNIPSIDEIIGLAKQASLGIAIEAVDQDINVMFNSFNDACRLKLKENDLKLISIKMNAINGYVYNVNEAYIKFKELLKNKDKSYLQKKLKLIRDNNALTDHVQNIYDEIIDPSDPVIIATLGHNKNPNSNVVTKSSAAYLLGLLYEVVVYTEIKSLAIQLYYNDISKEKDIDCLEERAKDKVKFRLSGILNNMNKAVERFTII